MALEEIKLWAMDGAGDAEPLPPAGQTESERLLEDTLVKNPDMLMPGLTLVGRQTRTEGGPLDLLGVDRDGRLTLFELKRGSLNRDAVAQVLDYGSWLESLEEAELVRRVSDGAKAVGGIDDFEQWYDGQYGQELSFLRPIKLFLVGLGVDDTTVRMVRFLADKGIDISLLTFLGFKHAGQTVLARQVQVEVPEEPNGIVRPPRVGPARRRELLNNRIQEHTKQWPEAQGLWDDVLEMFRENLGGPAEAASPGRTEWAKHRLNLHIPGSRGRDAAIQLGPFPPHPELVCVCFFKRAVALCLDEFTQLRQEIPFQTWPPNRPESKAGVIEIQFVLKSLADWEAHKDKLAAVSRSVYEASLASEEE